MNQLFNGTRYRGLNHAMFSIFFLLSCTTASNAAELKPFDPDQQLENRSMTISGTSAGIAPLPDTPVDLDKSGHLDLEGPFSFSITNGRADMSVGAVVNHRPSGSISGTLELWLFATTYIPTSGQNTGYQLAWWRPSNWHGNSGNQLHGGYRVSDIDLENLTYSTPAAGCYYVSIFLMEWAGTDFVSRDLWTYTTEAFGLGGGSCSGPPTAPSGLSATPTSTTTIDLFWNDNSNNEDEFRVQMSTEGGVYQNLGTVSANSIGAAVSGLDPGTTYSFRVRAYSAADGFSPYSASATATTFSAGSCTPTATNLCLNNDRYNVRASYITGTGEIGQGFGIELTEDTGYFWFFTDNNVETVIKVLDACAINDKIWIFAGGLTNLGITLTVEDTATGLTWTGANASGQDFETITDTLALPCD